MTDFHKTQMGRKFYESTMPRIASALEELANPPEGYALTPDPEGDGEGTDYVLNGQIAWIRAGDIDIHITWDSGAAVSVHFFDRHPGSKEHVMPLKPQGSYYHEWEEPEDVQCQ